MEEPVMYAPSVVFTDEDVAEIGAVNKVLPNALDFRCQWHADRDLERELIWSHILCLSADAVNSNN